MNKNSIQMIFALLCFVVVATIAINFTYEKTKDKIEERTLAAKESSLKNVLSHGSTAFEDTLDGFGTYWGELNEKREIIGYAFIGEARGYSSTIRFFCGLDLNGKIKGLSIISQNETPGLGTRVVEIISDARFPFGLWQKQEKTNPWFCEQFNEISAKSEILLNNDGEWHTLSEEAKDKLLKNNHITVITGSTITTAAITKELNEKAKKLLYLLELQKKAYRKKMQTTDENSENGENELTEEKANDL
ncbi:MAG: FMN-binding protein [Chitinivibrionia bacterium]|nr:FMN-binding protein [Chitinivibrionia bacterium]